MQRLIHFLSPSPSHVLRQWPMHIPWRAKVRGHCMWPSHVSLCSTLRLSCLGLSWTSFSTGPPVVGSCLKDIQVYNVMMQSLTLVFVFWGTVLPRFSQRMDTSWISCRRVWRREPICLTSFPYRRVHCKPLGRKRVRSLLYCELRRCRCWWANSHRNRWFSLDQTHQSKDFQVWCPYEWSRRSHALSVK